MSAPEVPAAPRPAAPPRRVPPALLAILLLVALLAAAVALTRAPHADEGHFASAGATFAAEGRLAMPMWTPWIASLDERLYATMPLYFVALGGWFEAFGVSFAAMRMFSVLWGVVLVGAWYVVGGHLGRAVSATGSAAPWRVTALLTAAFVGLNYDVLNAASARYDIMTAALGALALACYLTLRERRLGLAIVASQALVCAACLVHPYGVYGGVGVALFALALDARRLRPRHLPLAAAPYAVGLGLWGLYIAQDPAMFREQFGENASGRLAAWRTPIASLATELRVRYLELLGGWSPDAPAAARAKVLLLPVYAGGILGCLLTPAIRRAPAARALLAYALAVFLMLTYLESNRWYIYLIHAVPVYAACAALFAAWLHGRGGAARGLALAGTAAFALFAVASVVYRARLDHYGRAYAPVMAYLQAHVRPGELVMAGGEFGVGLGFADRVLDDQTLGRRTGRTPDWVVISRDYEADHRNLRRGSPSAAHVADVLARYPVVFESRQGDVRYRVLVRPGR